MGNCLVKTLKGNTGGSLPVLGALSIMFDSDGVVESAAGSINVEGNFAVDGLEDSDGKLVMSSDTYTQVISNGNTTRALPWSISATGSGDGYGISLPSVANKAVIHFENAYKHLNKINLSALKNVKILNKGIIPHLENLKLFRASGAFTDTFDIDMLSGLQSLERVILNNCSLKGSLQSLINCKKYINLTARKTDIREITGNIEIFSSSYQLVYLAVENQSLVEGDVETLLDTMAANRTSGLLKIRVANSLCTSSIGTSPDVQFTSDRTTYPRGWYKAN